MSSSPPQGLVRTSSLTTLPISPQTPPQQPWNLACFLPPFPPTPSIHPPMVRRGFTHTVYAPPPTTATIVNLDQAFSPITAVLLRESRRERDLVKEENARLKQEMKCLLEKTEKVIINSKRVLNLFSPIEGIHKMSPKERIKRKNKALAYLRNSIDSIEEEGMVKEAI